MASRGVRFQKGSLPSLSFSIFAAIFALKVETLSQISATLAPKNFLMPTFFKRICKKANYSDRQVNYVVLVAVH